MKDVDAIATWKTLICGWEEVAHYRCRHPSAQFYVYTHGNGAVRVYLPTDEAIKEFVTS